MFKISIEDGGLTTRLTAISARAQSIGKPMMTSIGQLLVESVKQNFEVGGRPAKWIPSRSAMEQGRKTLVASGRLASSPFVANATDFSVETLSGEGLGMYPIFLSRGTNAQVVSLKQRKFFWAKFFETGLTSFKAMALSKILKGLPARRFSLVQDVDLIKIKEALARFIIRGEQEITIT